MAVKKSKKRPKMQPNRPIKAEPRQDKSVNEEDNIQSGSIDFGGLPERDLKKNLGGCG